MPYMYIDYLKRRQLYTVVGLPLSLLSPVIQSMGLAMPCRVALSPSCARASTINRAVHCRGARVVECSRIAG